MTNLKSLVNKGLVVVYIPLITIVVLLVSFIYILSVFVLKIQNLNMIMTIGIIFSIGLGWFWWSYKIVKWKIWALSKLNLDESKELYYIAVNSGLIWPKGNLFNKTEIWSNSDKNKWLKIKPEIRDIFY